MRVTIDEAGRVSECRVSESSGHAVLDEAACSGMIEHARYNPARGSGGQPISASVTQGIRYVLPALDHMIAPSLKEPERWFPSIRQRIPAGAAREFPDGEVDLSMVVRADGSVELCGAMNEGDAGPIVDRVCELIQRYAEFEPARLPDGTAVDYQTHTAFPLRRSGRFAPFGPGADD